MFNIDGISPTLNFSSKQRPVFRLSGLNQQSLPGTSIDEFWADGYVSLNKWSHLAFTYSQENRRARFYINGSFEGETSFSNNQVFPLSNAFRVGPQDGNQSLLSEGKIDDFRIYSTELSEQEISRLYGNGFGDFYIRNIEISYDSNIRVPKIITLKFLENGFPVKVNTPSIANHLTVTGGNLQI